MKHLFAFIMVMFCQFLISDLGLASRPMSDVKMLSYKPTSQKGVVMVENEVNANLRLAKESKAITFAISNVLESHVQNSKKVNDFLAPITVANIVRKLEENSSPVEPLGHSPGVGHNNPPGARP